MLLPILIFLTLLYYGVIWYFDKRKRLAFIQNAQAAIGESKTVTTAAHPINEPLATSIIPAEQTSSPNATKNQEEEATVKKEMSFEIDEGTSAADDVPFELPSFEDEDATLQDMTALVDENIELAVPIESTAIPKTQSQFIPLAMPSDIATETTYDVTNDQFSKTLELFIDMDQLYENDLLLMIEQSIASATTI